MITFTAAKLFTAEYLAEASDFERHTAYQCAYFVSGDYDITDTRAALFHVEQCAEKARREFRENSSPERSRAALLATIAHAQAALDALAAQDGAQ